MDYFFSSQVLENKRPVPQKHEFWYAMPRQNANIEKTYPPTSGPPHFSTLEKMPVLGGFIKDRHDFFRSYY
jgi:hypothetical protein